jgi:hypothetical protein
MLADGQEIAEMLAVVVSTCRQRGLTAAGSDDWKISVGAMGRSAVTVVKQAVLDLHQIPSTVPVAARVTGGFSTPLLQRNTWPM